MQSSAPVSMEPQTETGEDRARATTRELVPYLLLGIYFGIVLTKSEVISWFRIQEMFRFQAFHMYGIIGSAVVVAALALALMKRFGTRTWAGNVIHLQPKPADRIHHYWIGGSIFGVGWALTGACPGPLYALIGNGIPVMAVALVSAVAGTWAYGALRDRLPH